MGILISTRQFGLMSWFSPNKPKEDKSHNILGLLNTYFDEKIKSIKGPLPTNRVVAERYNADEIVLATVTRFDYIDIMVTYSINPSTYQYRVTECSIKAGAEGDIVENVTPQNWINRLKEEEDSYATNEYDEYTTLYQTLNGDKYGKQDLKDADKFFKQEYNKTLPTFLINTLKQYINKRGDYSKISS